MTIYAPDHTIHDHVNTLPQHLKDRPSKIDTLKHRPSNIDPQTQNPQTQNPQIQTLKLRQFNIDPQAQIPKHIPSNTHPSI